jgi:hypothetical protein
MAEVNTIRLLFIFFRTTAYCDPSDEINLSIFQAVPLTNPPTSFFDTVQIQVKIRVLSGCLVFDEKSILEI